MNREEWIQYKKRRNAAKKNPMAGNIGYRYGKKCVPKVLLRFHMPTEDSLRLAVIQELNKDSEFSSYIQAIKRVRELDSFEMGLKEAKDFVDKIRDEINWKQTRRTRHVIFNDYRINDTNLD
jgi:hypothetical protein